MNIKIVKRDIQLLLDLGYNIRPINHQNIRTLYSILYFNKSNSLFTKLPFDVIRYSLFPYLYDKFDIDKNMYQFKIIIEKKKIKWIVYFKISNIDNYNIPISKIISNNKKYVNLRSIKKTIENRYYITYINWLPRFTLPFIMLQIRLIMNKWLISNKIF